MAHVSQPAGRWLPDAGPAPRLPAEVRTWPADHEAQPLESDSELFHEHLRPAWHVVAATAVVLGAAVLASWLGH